MNPDAVEHKLVAITGYSRLMASDEVATVRELQAGREHVEVFVRQHCGRVVDSPGDNLLTEFASAPGTTRCAGLADCLRRPSQGELPAPLRSSPHRPRRGEGGMAV